MRPLDGYPVRRSVRRILRDLGLRIVFRDGIPGAIANLAAGLTERRDDPHVWDHIHEHVYSRSCADRVYDHEQLDQSCGGMETCTECVA